MPLNVNSRHMKRDTAATLVIRYNPSITARLRIRFPRCNITEEVVHSLETGLTCGECVPSTHPAGDRLSWLDDRLLSITTKLANLPLRRSASSSESTQLVSYDIDDRTDNVKLCIRLSYMSPILCLCSLLKSRVRRFHLNPSDRSRGRQRANRVRIAGPGPPGSRYVARSHWTVPR